MFQSTQCHIANLLFSTLKCFAVIDFWQAKFHYRRLKRVDDPLILYGSISNLMDHGCSRNEKKSIVFVGLKGGPKTGLLSATANSRPTEVCDASKRLKHVKLLSVKKLHAKSTKSRTLCPKKQSWLGLCSHTPLGTLLMLNNARIYDLRGIFCFYWFFTFLR